MKLKTAISAIFLSTTLVLAGGTNASAMPATGATPASQEATLKVDGYDGFELTINKGTLKEQDGNFVVEADSGTEVLPTTVDAGDAGKVHLTYKRLAENRVLIKPAQSDIDAQGAWPKGTTKNWDKSFDKCVSEAAVGAAAAGAVGGFFATGPIGAIIAAAGGALGNGVAAWFTSCNDKPAYKK